MAQSGSNDLQYFCCTCEEVIDVSKEEHEGHEIREKEQAKNITKLN